MTDNHDYASLACQAGSNGTLERYMEKLKTSHDEDHEDDARDLLDENHRYASPTSPAGMMTCPASLAVMMSITLRIPSISSNDDHDDENHRYASPAAMIVIMTAHRLGVKPDPNGRLEMYIDKT